MSISVVYFIREIRYPHSPVKIGYSASGSAGARKRLLSMQTGNPRRLAIVAMMKGDRHTEQDVHRKLAHFCVHDEWFKWSPPVERMVKAFALREPIIAQADKLPEDAAAQLAKNGFTAAPKSQHFRDQMRKPFRHRVLSREPRQCHR